ncbi:hypothetical protein CR513_19079, partial [Mucuna pruriens]
MEFKSLSFHKCSMTLMIRIHTCNWGQGDLPGQANVQRMGKSPVKKACSNLYYEDSVMEQMEDSLTGKNGVHDLNQQVHLLVDEKVVDIDDDK